VSELETRFAAAAEEVKELPNRPDNATLLELYALFKQGSEGDVEGSRPGMTAFVERAKYDAWAKLAGTTQDDAKQQYIARVEGLKTS
jgi:acyl-CoA-binding protein